MGLEAKGRYCSGCVGILGECEEIMCRVVLFRSGSQMRWSNAALCKCSSADPTLDREYKQPKEAKFVYIGLYHDFHL